MISSQKQSHTDPKVTQPHYRPESRVASVSPSHKHVPMSFTSSKGFDSRVQKQRTQVDQ